MAKLDIPDGTLLTKEEVEKLINDRLLPYMDAKFEKVLEAIGNTEKPEEPNPPLKKCEKGPVLGPVTKLSDKQLKAMFDAVKVEEMKATVRTPDGVNILTDVISSKTRQSLQVKGKDKGVFAPDNNSPTLVLSESVGTKRLEIKFVATLCSGESTFFFESGTKPPPIENPCPDVPGVITKLELTRR